MCHNRLISGREIASLPVLTTKMNAQNQRERNVIRALGFAAHSSPSLVGECECPQGVTPHSAHGQDTRRQASTTARGTKLSTVPTSSKTRWSLKCSGRSARTMCRAGVNQSALTDFCSAAEHDGLQDLLLLKRLLAKTIRHGLHEHSLNRQTRDSRPPGGQAASPASG